MPNTVDLYGEDGIKIGVTAEGDAVHLNDPDAVVIVAGHNLYVCSAEEARKKILREYMDRKGKAWHPYHGWISKSDPAMRDL
jgi:hypothetical protein